MIEGEEMTKIQIDDDDDVVVGARSPRQLVDAYRAAQRHGLILVLSNAELERVFQSLDHAQPSPQEKREPMFAKKEPS